MKILILSCNTGGGHNTAAKALKEVFDSRNDECIIKDALSFGGQFASELVCDSYIEMVKKAPKMFGELYKAGNRLGQLNSKVDANIKSPVYLVNKIYADALDEYINENNFDAIVSCHIFPAEALTHLRRKHNLQIPVYFVMTDYACPPMAEELEVTKIFTAHKDSIDTFYDKGIDENLLVPTGIPVSQKFTAPSNKPEARKQLGLNENDEIYLLMSGSMGFGDTLNTAKDILAGGNENTKIIVITGNNKEMYSQFEQEFNEEQRLILVGFTDKVPVYMDACDVLLTKPGGLSSTEALVKCVPIIHTSPIPGCETENVEFFTQHHISLCANDSKTASRLALRLMNDKFLRNQIIEAQKQYRYENSAVTIVDYIHSHVLA